MGKRGKRGYFYHCNFFPKDRRGNHVEIVISFIIFITFVIFLFASVQPSITKQEDKKNTYENIELKILERVSSDVTVITFNITAGGANCVNLDNLLGELSIGENLVVKDASGTIIPSSIDGSSLQLTRTSTDDTLFKIYYSEVFDELPAGSGCGSVNYDIGLTKTNKYVSEERVNELIVYDYDLLKEELKVSKGNNFGYGLAFSNGTVIAETTNDKELSTSIYIKETPVEYIDLQGNIKEGYLRIKIW